MTEIFTEKQWAVSVETENRLPEGFTSRPAAMEDAAAVTDVLNAASLASLGVARQTAEDQANDWMTPGFDVETDTRVVLAPDGRIVAYYEVFDRSAPHVHMYVGGQVHPAYIGRGISSYLLDWAQERAARSIPKAPAGTRVVVHSFVPSKHAAARELMRNAGFELVRYSLRMVIDLPAPPPEPHWPDGIELRPFDPERQLEQLVAADRDAFRDHWGFVERPLEEDVKVLRYVLETEPRTHPGLWFIAWDGDQIAGLSLCLSSWYDDPELGWVSTLGVLRPWRRRGLGLALLQHSFGELYRLGRRKVALGVDASSLTGATRLYLKAGMHSDPNWEYVQFEKELRPGVDISTQSLDE